MFPSKLNVLKKKKFLNELFFFNIICPFYVGIFLTVKSVYVISWTCTTMGQERLSDLIIIHIQKDIVINNEINILKTRVYEIKLEMYTVINKYIIIIIYCLFIIINGNLFCIINFNLYFTLFN